MPFESPLHALLSVLRCPGCQASAWRRTSARSISCSSCGRANGLLDGILHVNVLDEHPEVIQERASVPATEGAPDLGGWADQGYAPATDPSSSLGQAYLSLPYGNDSTHFHEPGYFQNVRRFAPEFDFVLEHLPHAGLVLDIGADGTWSTARLARRGLTGIALDITDHLALARLFQTACPRYALVNVDMHEPVFVDEAFDVVTAFNALHHSKRLDELTSNIARILKPGGTLGFVEPYVQNAQQEADFGAPQSAAGINENVHTLDRWHRALTNAGLTLQVFSLSDSFNAIYRKTPATAHALLMASYYDGVLTVTPTAKDMRAGTWTDFTVTVESRGRAAWASRGPLPVRLSYHVSRVEPTGSVMFSFDNHRHLLTSFLSPGQPQQFRVPIELKESGLYEVEFDLVHEAISWFKDRGGQTAIARVKVT